MESTKGGTLVDFAHHRQSLENRLKSIKIESPEAEEQARKSAKRLIRDKLMGLFKITDLINTILKWNEETEKAIKSLKRDKLIEVYFEIADKNNEAISRIKDFLINPSGNVLFNKIMQITDDNPPDVELLRHLATVLFTMINSNFEALFSAHKHALSQIGRLTPQALTILADAQSWPSFGLGTFSTSDGIVTSDWTEDFSRAYSSAKGVRDNSISLRISHSIAELQGARLIVAARSDKSEFKVHYTAIGNEIQKYVRIQNSSR